MKLLGGLGGLSLIKDRQELEADVNSFLAKDGSEIKVIEVKYQAASVGSVVIETVCVYYEELVAQTV